jgi:hypothetical protein
VGVVGDCVDAVKTAVPSAKKDSDNERECLRREEPNQSKLILTLLITISCASIITHVNRMNS